MTRPLAARPRSPFAAESFEPRFVVNHHAELALRAAVDLWFMSCNWYSPSAPELRYVQRRADHLLLAWSGWGRGDAPAPWEKLPQPLAKDAIAPWVMAWLDGATYPEQPWFDGGERRGFSAYCVHFRSKESIAYGSLVVLPTWFEVHK